MADLGAPCFASGSTAAALHGFDGYRLCEPFDITVLRNRNTLLRRALIPYQFTDGQVVGEPQSVVAEVGAALEGAEAA